MLQLCGINKKMLPYISERNPFKIGLRTLGTDMILISEEEARKLKPDCMFVIPWNFKEEILEERKGVYQKGRKTTFYNALPIRYR